ncbi:MAG: hypothetical protein ABIL46_05100 [candidate division WOR-3 bacterium]
MTISKSKLVTLIKKLPEEIDIEEVMYRLYMLQKIETGENAINKGKIFSHKTVLKKFEKRWRK